MIKGIGIDILSINRFREIVKRNPKVLNRILTINEINLFKNYNDPIIHYAGRFSLKEAIIKAGKNSLNIKSFLDIEILKDSEGKPKLIKPKGKIFISISHEREYVVSIAVIEK